MAILGLLASTVFAAAAPTAADAWQQCINSTATNVEWGSCGVTYLKRLDDALNASWHRAYDALDDQQSRTQLLEEQRAWLKFRDASCQFYANGSFGRDGQVLHFASCRGGILTARIADLNTIYELTHQDSN